MLTAAALRSRGSEGLAAVLRSRPEVLEPVPPRSMDELAARLTHPHALSAALRRMNRPTLQVAEVLAALGGGAERARVERLLGVDGDADRRAAVDAALDVLRDQLMLDGTDRLIAPMVEGWPAPLGLGPPLTQMVPARTAEDLKAVLRTLGVAAPARKAEVVERVTGVLADPEQVREIVARAPDGLAELLRRAAFGQVELTYYGYFSPRYTRHRGTPAEPVEWALARLLVVRLEWESTLVMPAEVALALRGPDWSAPFAASPPPVAWTPVPADLVSREAAAAGANAVRVVGLTLEVAGAAPIQLLKSDAVGVRELRRVAKAAGCTQGEVRLALALGFAAGLVGLTDEGIAPTGGYDRWSALPPAGRLGRLVTAWADLAEAPLADPGAAWMPRTAKGVPLVRRAVLQALATHPGAAPGSAAELAARVSWAAPLALGGSLSNGPATPDGQRPAVSAEPGAAQDIGDRTGDGDVQHEAVERTVLALLAEAAWLGVTGAGTLAPAGAALAAGQDVATAVGDRLGAMQTTARLQADLTAVVLGHPSADLAAALDRMADREEQSSAVVWRFSPASVRRALDGGAQAPDLIAALVELAEGAVPQPLAYLVNDAARRHGVLRGATVACYLRSDDATLLAELTADRRLRKLGLRQIAPTVVVGTRPLGETLTTLRAAGHAPVEETPDGSAVLSRPARHRAAGPRPAEHTTSPRRTTPREGATPAVAPNGAAPPDRDRADASDDPDTIARRLLASPDKPRGRLLDLPTGVIDATLFESYLGHPTDP